MQEMKFEPFKRQDIFECRQCGKCCKGHGGTYITEKNILAIADFIKVDKEYFLDNFCVKSGTRFLLGQKKDGFCHFFKDKICSIHPVKPAMCRNWPFIKSVLIDPFNWNIMARFCKGMRRDVPFKTIKAIVSEEIKKRNSHLRS